MAATTISGALLLSAIVGSSARSAPRKPVLPPQQQATTKFLGSITCAGPACHARPEPSDDRPRSQQTEFTTWSTKDKHHKAFAVLAEEKSLDIARRLKLAGSPQESDRCLNCHSMNVLEPARRGLDFKLSDGVSCDGCHGPADLWFRTHLDEPYAESLAKGMKNIRNPVVRAEMCLSCHLGDCAEQKIVDHEMLAAGHPQLVFELESYSRKLPPHWREKKADGENVLRAQLWATGQVVTLRVAARMLEADSRKGPWPEYAHFDCAACHHDLKEDGWRQLRPRVGPPGRPLWRAAATANIVRQLDDGAIVSNVLDNLHRQLSSFAFGRPGAVSDGALELESPLLQLASSTSEQPLSVDEARKLAARLCDAAQSIAWHGPAAAQQISFGLAALLGPLIPADSAVIEQLDALQSELSGPSASTRYDPQEFLRRVSAIRAQVP